MRGLFLRAVPKLSIGGGLVTSLADMVALSRSLLPGGETLLKPETIAQMMTNQLAGGVSIRFATHGDIPGKGFGLGGSVTLAPSSLEPPGATGEFQLGVGVSSRCCPTERVGTIKRDNCGLPFAGVAGFRCVDIDGFFARSRRTYAQLKKYQH